MTSEKPQDDPKNATEPAPASEKPPVDMRALGRMGGLKGGPARAQKLSPERRKEIARLGGIARQYAPEKTDDGAGDV